MHDHRLSFSGDEKGDLPDDTTGGLNVLCSGICSLASCLVGTFGVDDSEGFIKIDTEFIFENQAIERGNVVVRCNLDVPVDNFRLGGTTDQDIEIFFGVEVLTEEVFGDGTLGTIGIIGLEEDKLSIWLVVNADLENDGGDGKWFEW